MSNSQPSEVKFWIIAITTLLASTGSMVALWPLTHTESTMLTRDAAKASGGDAAADYQLAVWLDPANQTAWLHLATAQLAANQPATALASLSQTGQGIAATRLRVRTLLELGRHRDALAAAKALTGSAATQNDLILAILTDALNGHTSAPSLTSRITAPEALQALQRVQGNNVTLAAQLYTNGLPRSSSTILQTLSPSYERNLLLARIDFAWQTPASLTRAANLLTTATSLSPAGLAAHQLLAQVYRAQHNTVGLATQTHLVTSLQSGRL